MAEQRKFLFGGKKPWNAQDWTASDDRVRGGISVSNLECGPEDPIACFNGNLDITALGGAGFASQRTTGKDRLWDLTRYDGIELDITQSDNKQYTLILKDEILDRDPTTGREQSTVSYEYDFKPGAKLQDAATCGNGASLKVFVRWKDLKATYRGREKKDAPPLSTQKVKRISLMNRSFFGEQQGDFSLSVRSIAAVSPAEKEFANDLNGSNLAEKGERDLTGHERAQKASVWRFCAIL